MLRVGSKMLWCWGQNGSLTTWFIIHSGQCFFQWRLSTAWRQKVLIFLLLKKHYENLVAWFHFPYDGFLVLHHLANEQGALSQQTLRHLGRFGP